MVARSYVNLVLDAQPEYRTLGVHQGRDALRSKITT